MKIRDSSQLFLKLIILCLIFTLIKLYHIHYNLHCQLYFYQLNIGSLMESTKLSSGKLNFGITRSQLMFYFSLFRK